MTLILYSPLILFLIAVIHGLCRAFYETGFNAGSETVPVLNSWDIEKDFDFVERKPPPVDLMAMADLFSVGS